MRNYQYDPGEATLPAEPTFTEEDRERVRRLIEFNREQIEEAGGIEEATGRWFDEACLGDDLASDADALTRALAYIEELEARVERAEGALESLHNRDREACEQLARAALKGEDDETNAYFGI